MKSLTSSTKILFIGDSITDCGQREDPERLGGGFVRLIRDYFLATDPANAPIVLNRGHGGNKVTDLAARWKEDALDLAPDIISIKIGINDVWHGLSFGPESAVPVEKFTVVLDDLLQQVRDTLPDTTIVLCEPSVIWPPGPEEGNEMLLPYIEEIHKLAAKHSALCVVELHEAFESAKEARPDVAWTGDGVHPTSAGHMLIAQQWISATGF
jgi:lysophospholipase L1-like esterase